MHWNGVRPVVACLREFCAYSGPREEAVPAVLVVMTVGPVISPNLLNLPLSLAVSLGVIPRGEADGDIEELEESLPDTGYKLWPTVRDDIFQNAEGA